MGALIGSGYGSYVGTSNEIKTSFNLTFNTLNIFRKEINSESSSSVGLGSTVSTLNFDQHFFVTGEELEYDYGSGSPIGIATTVISGLSTDKLPSRLYAIKVNSNKIRVATTPENALKFNPEFLELTSLGIGTQHYFNSKKQNTKSLISIDNVIQAPVASTGTTSLLIENINTFVAKFSVYDETQFSSGDLIKIDNEIMKVNSVGVGGTNKLMVQREFLGTSSGIHTNGALISKLSGNYNIVNNTLYFSAAPYGNVPQENPSSQNDTDYLGITTSSSFSGRIFLRTAEPDTTNETYEDNYIFDNISNQIIGLTTSYELTVEGQNITNISENNSTILVRDIFQTPRKTGPKPILGDYYLSEESGETKIYFTGSKSQTDYDINSSDIPLGGVIVSVGSTSGNGYQPLVSAGATALVSIAGTIQSISIGNSGSGYRSGIQTNVNVGVKTENLIDSTVEIVGIASISDGNIISINITNPGIGYTSTNLPTVIIDPPVGYKNIPLVYSQYSQSGIGTGATIDLEVSLSGEISSFEIKNSGYGYRVGDILTIGIGGTVGIPTNTSISFNEFQIYVDETYKDDVSGWTFGELEVLDSFDPYFNGTRKKFFIRKNGLVRSIRARKGSDIDVEQSLLVFINNVLQVPGEAYTFTGGSVITFKEAPKSEDLEYPGSGDKSKILFYRGTKDIDVVDKDILETIEEGDIVNIDSDTLSLDQDNRLVTSIISSDSINTNPYPGPGLSEDETLLRPISWCKSKLDKFIDGKEITKDRIYNEALINPVTNIIQSVGIGSTAEIFVENVKSFFDNQKELATDQIKSTIEIISQDQIKSEVISDVNYEGDFGIISGITTTTVGIGSTAIILSMLIPPDSVLNDPEIVSPIIPVSGISTGTFFSLKNTNIGYGITSLYNDGSILSIGSTFIDNVYQAYSADFIPDFITSSVIIFGNVTYSSPAIVSDGITVLIEDGGTMTVSDYIPLKVTTLIQDYNGIDSILSSSQSNYFGEYSWGRITTQKRKNPKQFTFYQNVTSGISTSPVVRRLYPLKYLNYNP
jgi:hypothetical protein